MMDLYLEKFQAYTTTTWYSHYELKKEFYAQKVTLKYLERSKALEFKN